MIAQLKAAATRPAGLEGPAGIEAPAAKVNFADALKSSLDQVNNSQVKADQMGQSFAMGDDKVSLSDVMISMQKANISFQASVQVRNKLSPEEGRCRRLGSFYPFGLKTSVTVSELLPPLGPWSSLTGQQLDDFEAAVDAVAVGRWTQARGLFERFPETDGYSRSPRT